MTTNILVLPQLSGTLTAVTNADLRLAVQFTQAGSTTPLDLTGIDFRSQWRLSATPDLIGLDTSVANGLLQNGGVNGVLSWLVPASAMKMIAPGAYEADLLAIADGAVVNLFQTAPLAIVIAQGLTC